jgi:nicotinamidase-related amidase
MKIHGLLIDVQNDFCDPKGSLYVPGADKDAQRLANMLIRIKDKIDDIHFTLDTHHFVDIAHPVFWINSEGKHPAPFTLISVTDVETGIWRTTNPQFRSRALDYVRSLRDNARYVLCIWPPHCLIGSWGHCIYPLVYQALTAWEKDFAMVDFVTKGSNFWTEHYSAVQADVPDATDPTTMINTRLIQTLQDADLIFLSGQALSHCVASTVKDIANNFGEENIKKLVLITDTTSPVSGFEPLAEVFIKEMTSRGMQLSTAETFLSEEVGYAQTNK